MKKDFNKELLMTKIVMILGTLLNLGFVIITMFMVMLKQEIIVISLENVEALHIEIVISTLN